MMTEPNTKLAGQLVKRNSDGAIGRIMYYWGGNKFMIRFGTINYIIHRRQVTFIRRLDK
jgi:hypothetical protein